MLVTNWVNRSDGTLVWQPGMEVHVKHMKRKDVPAWASATRREGDAGRGEDAADPGGGAGGEGSRGWRRPTTAAATGRRAVGVKRKSRAGRMTRRRRRRTGDARGCPGGAERERGWGGWRSLPAKRANVASEEGEPEDAVEEGERRRADRRGRGRDAAAGKGRDAAPDADADEDRPASEPPSTAAPPDDDIDGLGAMDDDIGGAAATAGGFEQRRARARKLKVSFASVVKKG